MQRNISTYESYGVATGNSKDAEYRYNRVNYSNAQEKNLLQRSISADNVVIRSRGFKPSDRHDPVKRNFLEHLTTKILHFDMVSLDSPVSFVPGDTLNNNLSVNIKATGS